MRIVAENLTFTYNKKLEKNPIDENLKDTDSLRWTGLMNNYKNITNDKENSFVLESFIGMSLTNSAARISSLNLQ